MTLLCGRDGGGSKTAWGNDTNTRWNGFGMACDCEECHWGALKKMIVFLLMWLIERFVVDLT